MDLPENFDVVIIGTGMPECIIAAAASRVGKTVLHLDRNGYYGGDWASFNFDQFMDWIEENKVISEGSQNGDFPPSEAELDVEERLVPCIHNSCNITNLIQKSYVSDTHSLSELGVSTSSETPMEIALALQASGNEPSQISQPENLDGPPELHNATTVCESSNVQGASDAGDNSALPSTSNSSIAPSNAVVQQEWTLSSFRENRRKFNFDLAPKLLFARGSLVELLISSNIARYAEFQCVNRVLTFINDHIEQVPCSRADVFSTKNVTVVEKRMLMKLLTFCMNYQDHPEEYIGFEDRTFLDFLHSRKLTANIEHYVMHAIAMVDESCLTLQGLEATQKFMQSLGRYGNSPFLWTCYGSAELPQCFCRLCAVFGGIYYLQRKAEALIISNNRCNGIISMGQRISSQWVIMESSYAPLEFMPEQEPQFLSRAIFITDASLLPSERQQNTLLRLPPMAGLTSAVTVLEFGSKAYVCPEDLYIVYMFCHSSSKSPEDDLKPAVDLLFQSDCAENLATGENVATKSNILWSLYYNQKDTSTANLNSRVPEGVLMTSSPDVELDYEHAVKEAKAIFEQICPGEDFLPRAPDPEDIILENHANPGEGGKIENDVKDAETSNSEELNNESENPDSTPTDDHDSSEFTNEIEKIEEQNLTT